MSVTLKELCQKDNNKYSIKLHCRQNLLDISVAWVYLLEDIENNDFLRANELVITTGMQIHNQEDMLHLIDTLAKRKCCGLILNTGRYVLDAHITDEVCEYADKLNFPLLSMPWKVHIAEIMQDFCMMLSQQALIDNTLALSFENALISPEYSESYIPTITQGGYDKNGNYCVVTITSKNSAEMTKKHISNLFPKCNIISHSNYTILVLYNEQITQFNNLIDNNKRELTDYVEYIGVGSTINDLIDLHKSYRESVFVHKVATSSNAKIQYFSALGLFRIFYETQDKSILESIAKTTLSSIIAYDSIHNSEYFETLKVYLNHGSSILETALIMNTHRNTINYRMRKIREILGKDLDDPQYVFNLMLAYNIMDYLDISTLKTN
ncbi:MAG: PucR family transcriptional regulator [Lachnospirales bacterium]